MPSDSKPVIAMSAPAQNNVDLDALLDLSEYDTGYNSPSLSPSATSKPTYATSPAIASVTAPDLSSSSKILSGPSHNYDLYRQQTGFVPGALANTMAVNQSNNTGYQDFGRLNYLSGFTSEQDVFDFNTTPPQPAMDMDFEPSAAPSNIFGNTINPSKIEQGVSSVSSPSISSSTSSSVGRLWPGAHSQAALVKEQTRQRQQSVQLSSPRQQKSRDKKPSITSPIVEQKITQVLNSMRANASSSASHNQAVLANFPRSKKEDDEMDEDERLLASEEGKKLSSKERRQLRNKVSARAFRSRRKEYISQLESEIAKKADEVGDLRSQNRALLDENKRLSDLTRMLLSSPSFSNFLDNLSTDPTALAGPQPTIKVEPQQQLSPPEPSQIPKDVNPYGNHGQQEQIGMAMIPEQTMDFSGLSIDSGSYHFQPQVFLVDTPDFPPDMDLSHLSGKDSDPVEDNLASNLAKVEAPAVRRPTVDATPEPTPIGVAPVDDDFESDPEFALFHSEPAASLCQDAKTDDGNDSTTSDIFGGINFKRFIGRYELVNAPDESVLATVAMARVQRISAGIESVVSRLELLTMGL